MAKALGQRSYNIWLGQLVRIPSETWYVCGNDIYRIPYKNASFIENPVDLNLGVPYLFSEKSIIQYRSSFNDAFILSEM